jgi:uncharacterized integral membrane protein
VRRDPDDPNDAAPERPPRIEYRREGPGVTAILLIVTAVLLVIFVLQNLEDANIDFLFWEWDVAIAVAIVVSAALGFVIGWLVAWLRGRARRDRRARRD